MTAMEKLNKRFSDCKNHRDFYVYFMTHRHELMYEERLQIIKTGDDFVLQNRWRNGEHYYKETYEKHSVQN